MDKVIGYILAVIGLILIAFSEKIATQFSIAGGKISVITIAVVIIIVSIFFIKKTSPSKKGKIQQEKEEVPIYTGEGKNRKIVAYQKESKK